MGKRSFAGYVCEESLSLGLFGETFRGLSRNGEEARVVVVDAQLSSRKNFAVALARSASDIAELMHAHIATTQKVGRGKDGSLVVIASAVEGPTELPMLLELASGHLAEDVALAIAVGALAGLAHAHKNMVTHGAVHPRSILIDDTGVSKLADFGLAFALVSAASKPKDTELLSGLSGFLAPELLLGQEPDQSSDVYSAAALTSHLIWGTCKPPTGERSALGQVLEQALETERMRRFSNAVELEAAVRDAIEGDGLEIASASRVCSYVLELGRSSGTDLDGDTEDFLADLALDSGEHRRPSSSGLEKALAGLDDEDSRSVIVSNSWSDPVDPLAGFSDEDEHTEVDDSYDRMETEDPLEAIILQQPQQELPPAVVASASDSGLVIPIDVDDYDESEETPLPPARPFHEDHTHSTELVELVGEEAATSAPFEGTMSLPAAPARFRTLRWLALIVFVLAMLFAVAYTKTDLLRGAQRDNEDKAAEARKKIEQMQPRAGQIVLQSDVEDAAVWLFLGQTPATSFPLSSSMVHEVRIEHDGYVPLFLSVAAPHWSGPVTARRAVLSASLRAAEKSEMDELPAFPPVANPALTPGGPGQGVVVVESVPGGAEVWLWVGTTPTMTLAQVEAGREYKFKILKDGFKPGAAIFEAGSWYLSGSEGPMRETLTKRITLEPNDAKEPQKDSDERRRKRKKRR